MSQMLVREEREIYVGKTTTKPKERQAKALPQGVVGFLCNSGVAFQQPR